MQGRSEVTLAQHGGDFEIYCVNTQEVAPGVFVPIDPYIEVKSAYQEERAYENMEGMVRFVRMIDGILAGAVGNDKEKIRTAYDKLKSEGLWVDKRTFLFNQAMPHSIERNGRTDVGYWQWDDTENPMYSVNTRAYNDVIPNFGYGSTKGTVWGAKTIDALLYTGVRQYEIDDYLRAFTTEITDINGSLIRVADDPRMVKDYFSRVRSSS
jgi:hypothetical protein